MDSDNRQRVALITGSSGGVGRAISVFLAQSGADIVAHYHKGKASADEVAQHIQRVGKKCLVVKANITESSEVKDMVQQVIAEFGRIDILINCAAIFNDATIVKMPLEVWNEVLAVDFTGAFNCTKEVIPYMRQNNFGRIINISSVVGQTGVFGASNYAAAKAGLFGFTKSAAREVARYGITVNAVALGYIDTGMFLKLSPELQSSILKQIPMGRAGEPTEVAATVAFLASDLAGYITGQILGINGGYYM